MLTKAFTTEIDLDDHAENIGLKWFEKNTIPKDNVIRIYSELEPCSLEDYACKTKIKNNFKKANIEYSFPYPGGDLDKRAATIRRNSRKQRLKLLKKILK